MVLYPPIALGKELHFAAKQPFRQALSRIFVSLKIVRMLTKTAIPKHVKYLSL